MLRMRRRHMALHRSNEWTSDAWYQLKDSISFLQGIPSSDAPLPKPIPACIWFIQTPMSIKPDAVEAR